MRIQVYFDDHGLELIEDLKKRTGITTYKDLFNNALALLSWAVDQKEGGRSVASIDQNGMPHRELQMPVLEYAALRANKRNAA
jgi:hypothetical protein